MWVCRDKAKRVGPIGRGYQLEVGAESSIDRGRKWTNWTLNMGREVLDL